MPKAKPVSLFPLTFEEAMKALVKVDPEKTKKPQTKKEKKPKK